MAVGSVKMPSPCEGAELARSWSPGGGAPDPPPVQLRQKLRELPALLRSGLTLRRKSAAAAGRVSQEEGCGSSDVMLLLHVAWKPIKEIYVGNKINSIGIKRNILEYLKNFCYSYIMMKD
ncbi:rap guanine nucleotide exchange factor 5 [Limosa lapponica baueri]|uniref:Rap guanine nucleotide exchange factor 5 n=1 Tax=Limosa lapponica baueri TaxID=1758121 RepID=A0A2I0TEW1_LIMLA|nr:rap guanine nucleotide exchange factor 5 [Limosa lapponica baueri]